MDIGIKGRFQHQTILATDRCKGENVEEIRGGRGHLQMMYTIFLGFLIPSPFVWHLGRILRTNYMQTPSLCLHLDNPLPPPIVDVL